MHLWYFETSEHYIHVHVCQCDNDDMEIEKLRHFIHVKTGSLSLDMDTLLDINLGEDIQSPLSDNIGETHLFHSFLI